MLHCSSVNPTDIMNTLVALLICCIILQARIIALSARVAGEKVISIDEVKAQCIKDLSLDEEHIQKASAPHISVENDDQLNKFTECVWKKIKLQDNNGRIAYDALRDFMDQIVTSTFRNEEESFANMVKQLAHRAVAFCQQNPPGGSSHGQIAVKTLNCVMKKLQELFQLEN